MTAGGPGDVSRLVDRRMALAAEWAGLVGQVRGLDGFGDFLQPPRLADLLPAARNGPVVIVNVSQWRCDALLVTSGGVRVQELPGLTSAEVTRRTTGYLRVLDDVERATGALHAAGSQPDGAGGGDHAAAYTAARQALQDAQLDREQVLRDVLEWLWDAIASPVLTALGFTGPPGPGQPWPRLWWCPTGLLTLLPLHAAGYHAAGGDDPPRTVLDRVVSSYTPTLQRLLAAAAAPGPGSADGQLLIVALPDTPGQAPLPATARERDRLAELFGGRCTLLSNEAATRAAVRARLPDHRWVHFSCHGRQNLADPSSGGLLLADGILTIADIGAARYGGEFAFLSACQTATGGAALPDEAISLAAALHYTGYRHVIATLWSVYDRAAADIARDVYADLTLDGMLAPGRAAYALHAAVRRLRHGRRLAPSRWTPFIHTGP
jgi:hypothetical protein